jgi:hypothetical protein
MPVMLRHTVQLLLPQPLPLDPAELLVQLHLWRDDVEQIGTRALFSLGQQARRDQLVHVFPTELDAFAADLAATLRWSTAAGATERSTASIAIALTAPGPLPHVALIETLGAVIDAVLAPSAPGDREATVLHWVQRRQVMTYERFGALRRPFHEVDARLRTLGYSSPAPVASDDLR